MRRYLTDESVQRFRSLLDRHLGSAVLEALGDPSITEVLVNEDGFVRFKSVRLPGSVKTDTQLTAESVAALIQAVAHAEAQVTNEQHSIVEANLPFYGSRFTGILPPVTRVPMVAIRKPSGRVFSLDEYVEQGRLDPAARRIVAESVERRDNLLIVGGTHSGKTTFANAVLHEVSCAHPSDRLFIIEDVRELQCSSDDVAVVQTAEGADRETLLRTALRMSPTRIVVGEVRGREALTLLKSWTTGHPGGLCTVHADGAYEGLLKIEQLAAEATGGWVPRPLVAQAVDLVVFLRSIRGLGPAVISLARVDTELTEQGEYAWRMEWERCQ